MIPINSGHPFIVRKEKQLEAVLVFTAKLQCFSINLKQFQRIPTPGMKKKQDQKKIKKTPLHNHI